MVQDAVQRYHWSNDQVTQHPVIINMHQPESPSEPKPVSLCVVSDFILYLSEGCDSVHQDTGQQYDKDIILQ
jgi:hypothetical protein